MAVYHWELIIKSKINIGWCGSLVDEQQFRNLVVWLEDQKIRQYKIEERTALRTVSAVVWQEDFHKVSLRDQLGSESLRPMMF